VKCCRQSSGQSMGSRWVTAADGTLALMGWGASIDPNAMAR
jgi:hypothetical protein